MHLECIGAVLVHPTHDKMVLSSNLTRPIVLYTTMPSEQKVGVCMGRGGGGGGGGVDSSKLWLPAASLGSILPHSSVHPHIPAHTQTWRKGEKVRGWFSERWHLLEEIV